MHENLLSFGLRSIIEIITSVCDALIYLHEQKIIHCYVNSHSIFLVGAHTPKLANFEYAVEKCADPSQQKRSKVIQNVYINCAYNWLAPEIMAGDFCSDSSDMYSFCCVIWELFNSKNTLTLIDCIKFSPNKNFCPEPGRNYDRTYFCPDLWCSVQSPVPVSSGTT